MPYAGQLGEVRLPARRRPAQRHGLRRHADARRLALTCPVHARHDGRPRGEPPPRRDDHERGAELPTRRLTASPPPLHLGVSGLTGRSGRRRSRKPQPTTTRSCGGREPRRGGAASEAHVHPLAPHACSPPRPRRRGRRHRRRRGPATPCPARPRSSTAAPSTPPESIPARRPLRHRRRGVLPATTRRHR